MIFHEDELKHLGAYYLFTLFSSASMLILPFLFPYLTSLGNDYFHASLYLISFGLGLVIFQLPTGILADLYGRKKLIIIGTLLASLTAASIPLAESSRILQLVLFFLLGMSAAAYSGAEEALAVQTARGLKQNLQREYLIKRNSLTLIGLLISPLLGTLIYVTLGYAGLWWAMSLLILFAGVPLSRIPCPERVKTPPLSRSQLFQFLSQKPLLILLIALLFTNLITLRDASWQPTLLAGGLATAGFGIAYAFRNALSAIMPFLARLIPEEKDLTMLRTITLTRMLLILSLLAYHPLILIITIFILDSMLISLQDTISQHVLHTLMPEAWRATVSSSILLAGQAVGFILMPLYGLLSDLSSPLFITPLLALNGIPALILLTLAERKLQKTLARGVHDS